MFTNSTRVQWARGTRSTRRRARTSSFQMDMKTKTEIEAPAKESHPLAITALSSFLATSRTTTAPPRRRPRWVRPPKKTSPTKLTKKTRSSTRATPRSQEISPPAPSPRRRRRAASTSISSIRISRRDSDTTESRVKQDHNSSKLMIYN